MTTLAKIMLLLIPIAIISHAESITQFDHNKSYSKGDIVTIKINSKRYPYQSMENVPANSFIPAQGNPWKKYQSLNNWNVYTAYTKGQKVVIDDFAYEALFWTQGDNPSNVSNQNPSKTNGRPWYPIGEWHNLSEEEKQQLPNYEDETFYQSGDYVKFAQQIFFTQQSIQNIAPLKSNPWHGYVDWQSIQQQIDPAPASWPDHFFAPYADVLLNRNNVPNFAELAKQYNIKHFTTAFVVAVNSEVCIPEWGAVVPLDKFEGFDNINELRASGGDVMLSIGGAANTPLAAACSDTAELARKYIDLVNNFDLQAIDFDIEGAFVSDSVSIRRRSEALAIAQKHWDEIGRDVKIWITLPVLPSGLTADGQNVVTSLIEQGINFSGINLMTMDYGESACPQGQQAQCSIDAVDNTQRFLMQVLPYKSAEEIYAMLGTTPMIGVNDVTSEVLYPSGAEIIANHASMNNLGMVSMWSIARDKPATSPWEQGSANATSSGLSKTEAPAYSFSQSLNFTQNN